MFTRTLCRLSITGCAIRSGAVELSVAGRDDPVVVSNAWFLDNLLGASPNSAGTHQRLDDIFGEDSAFHPPKLEAVAMTPTHLNITWGDGTPPTAFSLAFLEDRLKDPPLPLAAAHPSELILPSDVTTWGKGDIQDSLPRADYTAAMETDEGCLEWLTKIRRHGFCLLEGCPPTEEEFDVKLVAKRAANYVRESVFGGIWTFGNTSEHADTAYTAIGLPHHTDGCYSFDPPGLQMLHCVRYEATGGLSSLVDGFHCLEILHRTNPKAFNTLAATVIPFRYLDPEKGVELVNHTPVIVFDRFSRLLQIRFNNCDRLPLPLDTPHEVYEAWNALTYIVKQEANRVEFPLRPGTCLVFDNWRLLHARTAFTGIRIMKGCYMTMDEFLSRLRVLRKRVQHTPRSA